METNKKEILAGSWLAHVNNVHKIMTIKFYIHIPVSIWSGRMI